jgi:hypothetical protein
MSLVDGYTPDYPSNSIDYYLSLFTSQYQNSPNYLAFATVFLQKLQDTSNIIDYMNGYFDLDHATGQQLDMLGDIVGQPRTVNFEPTDGNPVLDDDTYRILLKCRILINHWDGKLPSLYAGWVIIFPGGRIAIQDNQNMTLDVYLVGVFSQKIIDLIDHDYIVPRPEGVLVNYRLGQMPFFGHDRDDQYIAGFDMGYWA